MCVWGSRLGQDVAGRYAVAVTLHGIAVWKSEPFQAVIHSVRTVPLEQQGGNFNGVGFYFQLWHSWVGKQLLMRVPIAFCSIEQLLVSAAGWAWVVPGG